MSVQERLEDPESLGGLENLEFPEGSTGLVGFKGLGGQRGLRILNVRMVQKAMKVWWCKRCGRSEIVLKSKQNYFRRIQIQVAASRALKILFHLHRLLTIVQICE